MLFRSSVYCNKDGTLGNIDKSDALPGAQFTAILSFVRRRLAELADDWLDGNIAVQPRRYGDRLPCSSCEYQSVCRFETNSGDFVSLERLSRAEVMTRVQEKAK